MASPNSPSPPPVVAGEQQPAHIEELQQLFASVTIDQDDHELIEALKTLSKKAPKLVKSTEYQAPAIPSIFVRSWKMNEFKYYDIPSPFPTLARGLFTQDVKNASGKTKHRIVARGYDKFFNIGEVPWTTCRVPSPSLPTRADDADPNQWAALESHTAPLYTLTLKSNGCIIFIAALTPTKLLVTSKHSLGPSPGSSGAESHAQVGERWLRKHLAAAGKTEEQLAQTLWEKNWTAVAELCDDSFEEHVLPISAEKTGLHLHGLNACTGAFQTQPQPVVDAFAREWGFIPTASTVLNTIPEVKAFTEEIARLGEWNGEALEGFVVRTHVTVPPTRGEKPASLSPYPAGSSFFFKVKFDEPYLMYRDWREVTRTLLGKGPSPGNVPKSKLRRPETKLYVEWVCGEIKGDRSQFEGFNKGKGIIATRERFLKWKESHEGKKAEVGAEKVPEETGLAQDVDLMKGKVIIMPVAVPGVGKTTIAVALQHLFGFGHIQSDDISAKKAAPIFIKNVVQALKTHDVVIADKNNHLKQHRDQLREAAQKFSPPARLLALDWSFDLPLSTVHRICGDRIVARGDKHQSLHADLSGKSHEDVIWQFLKQAEELQDSEADVVVSMDVEEPLEDALARAVGAIVKYLGKEQPDPERMGQALAVARAYEPRSRGKRRADIGGGGGAGRKAAKDSADKAEQAQPPASSKKAGKAKSPPRYYGILAEVGLQGVVGPAIEGAVGNLPSEARKFWDDLVREERVQKRPHVTVVHSKSLPKEGELWELCRAVDALPRPPLFSFRLEHVVWSERIMAATVVDLAVAADDPGEVDKEAVQFVLHLPDEVKQRLHITVGTRDKNVPPVEARDLVTEWKRDATAHPGVWAVPLKDVWVKGRVKGLHN
ncbi:RNA ligase-domain-containing protein [Dichomitus squalens]|uniref:RNA ligase-domain-containing protein n=1 Tax=Dichomitus squalens TaxID=114155 RepID=A0A4Q9PRV6_9APHY|nr:RNA ligase-domain-containing protein [Dichomitus squalens]